MKSLRYGASFVRAYVNPSADVQLSEIAVFVYPLTIRFLSFQSQHAVGILSLSCCYHMKWMCWPKVESRNWLKTILFCLRVVSDKKISVMCVCVGGLCVRVCVSEQDRTSKSCMLWLYFIPANEEAVSVLLGVTVGTCTARSLQRRDNDGLSLNHGHALVAVSHLACLFAFY